MILFLVTHFRDGDRVSAFIEHLRALDPEGIMAAVAVVDNSPEEPFVYAPAANAAVYRAPVNLGYLNGCAFGWTSWLAEARPDPEMVAVSNTDVWLDHEFLRAVEDLDLEGVGVVAPDVRLPDGTPQNPFMVRRPTRTRLTIYRAIFGNAALTLVLQLAERVKLLARKASSGAPTTREIYAAHGSIFLLTKAFFSRGGKLDLDGFMWAEEIHIAEQARRHGLRTVLAPSLKATHQQRASTGTIAASQRRQWARERLRVVLHEYY